MMKPYLYKGIIGFLGLILLSGCTTMKTPKANSLPSSLTSCKFKQVIEKKVQLDYLVYLPKDYKKSRQKWPLVMFLHGAGERGTDKNLLAVHGPVMQIVKQKKEFPFILIAPQCPEDSWWEEHIDDLNALLEKVIDKYRVDKDRVYLTGISMGGEGTWKLAMRYPEKFAAIAPICGIGRPWLAFRLKNIPIWAFHGVKDSTIPVAETQKMEKALKEVKANARFTYYPKLDHNSWTITYDNPEFYQWLLAQRKSHDQ